MKRFSPITLVSWLGLGSVLIVAVAVAAVVLRSMGLLEEFAEREGLMRAQLAVATAHGDLDATHQSVVTSARLLARLPGLQRIMATNAFGELVGYLHNYCSETSAVDACGVLDGDRLLGVSTDDFPWDEAIAAHQAGSRKFVIANADPDAFYLGATSRVQNGRDTVRTITLKRIEPAMLATLSEEADVTVRFSHAPTGAVGEPWRRLHERAAAGRRPVAARLDPEKGLYGASMPVELSADDVTAFIDVDLETRSLDVLLGQLMTRLGATALGIVGIAGLAGVLYGRWLVRPVASLGSAASRIGQGDLETSVPVAGVPEVATLGTDMENMRRSLVKLTGELRQREAQAQAVLAGIVEGVFAVDAQRRIRYANPQFGNLVGQAPDDLVGRFCGDVLRPEPVDGRRPCDSTCPILAARLDPARGTAVERLQAGTGASRTMVIMSAAPVDGQQVQVLRDETDQEAARRARDTVLANVTHEFRTPLAAQMASIELLHDRLDSLSRAESEQMIRNIQRGGLRLMQLIDNLLESVRIDVGQLNIRQQAVALAEVVAAAEGLMKPLLDQRRQQLAVNLPPDLPDIVGDEIRLVQVFVNLLANASKFSPVGSLIQVGAGVVDGAVTAWVENDGAGIPADDKVLIFQPFHRSLGGEPRAPGLGLGLWIVKSIVERHRGTVDVQRTAAGRTRFSIRLPIEVAA